MGYRSQSDRKLCAVAYMLLVYALKNEGVFNALPEFGYRADGKPFLSNYPDICFSISHCRDVAACIISDVEVGVDVERVNEYDDELARAVCNDDEYRWIAGSPDSDIRARTFTGLWTRKESVAKWRGTGLACDPREILRGELPDMPDKGFHIASLYYQPGNFCISVCRNNNIMETGL